MELRSMWTRRSAAALAAVLAAAASPAFAADGALEISQACVATGCFPGDAPGFPVEIATAGSYVLTGNLEVPDENTTGIQISTEDGVSIDLGGFAILGPNICNNSDSCALTGTGMGVDGGRHVHVFHGTVRGMGGDGVNASVGSELHDLHLTWNGGAGLDCPVSCQVTRVRTLSNLVGMIVGGDVSSVVATLNVDLGVDLDQGILRDSVIHFNHGPGLEATRSLVYDSNVHGNEGLGMDLDAGTGYGGNRLEGNNGANPEVAGGFQLRDNLCNGALCP